MSRAWPRRALVASFVVAGLLAPPLLEHGAAEALHAKLGRCSSDDGRCGGVGRVEVDLEGLRLGDLWLERERFSLRARTVVIGPGRRGITARIDGLQALVVRNEKAADRPPREATSTGAKAPGADGEVRALPRWLRGIPILVETRGALVVELANETVLALRDVRIRIGTAGGVEADLLATVSHPQLRLESRDRLVARTEDMTSGTWRAEGAIALEDGAPAKLRAVLTKGGARIEVHSVRGGSADLVLPRDFGGGAAITVAATKLPLDILQPLGRHLPFAADLQDAVLEGHIRLRRQEDGLAAELDRVRLRGLAIESPFIARGEVLLDDLGLDGEARLEGGELHGDLEMSHRKAKMHVRGVLGRDRVDVRARLARVGCQDLLDSVPDGITTVIDGMALAGDIDGSLRLRVAVADAREALAHEQRTGHEQPPPGRLDVEFPFVERCRVLRDAPSVNLVALRGPYRYDFVTDSGRQHERLLDRRAPGFVPLAAVPNVARAFVTLEDARFWSHHGFDVEQIERAVWHNVAVGRVERGASTITQQTARSLWLGLDRSLSRKLQEAVLAARLEQGLSKQRILEIYLNVIELGPDIHGVADAARFHFGKPATELDLLEAVHLAALAPGPRLFSKRFASGQVDEEWMGELRRQIRRMYLHGKISREAMRSALRDRLVLVDHTAGEEST